MTTKVTWTLDGDEMSWAGWAEARAGVPASPFVRELISAHPAPAGAWALDVGCGTGSAFAPLAAAGYRVIGLDPTEAAVEHSYERRPCEGLPAAVVQASAAHLPIADGCVTFLFAVATLFHLGPAELTMALREVQRALQPGGQAVLHFLDADDWRRSLAPELDPERAPEPAYRAIVTCFASEEAVRGWIESAGLEIVSFELRTSVSEAGEQRNWIAECRQTS